MSHTHVRIGQILVCFKTALRNAPVGNAKVHIPSVMNFLMTIIRVHPSIRNDTKNLYSVRANIIES